MARAKKEIPEPIQPVESTEPETQNVLAFFKEDVGGYAGAYGVLEIEIPKEILMKHGKVVYKSEPDIFGIFLNNVTKKARELIGI